MALLQVSLPPARSMEISYIPKHPNFWTLLQIAPLGSPRASQITPHYTLSKCSQEKLVRD